MIKDCGNLDRDMDINMASVNSLRGKHGFIVNVFFL